MVIKTFCHHPSMEELLVKHQPRGLEMSSYHQTLDKGISNFAARSRRLPPWLSGLPVDARASKPKL